MNKLIIRAIGLILIVGIISVGCDSMVDGDLALNESQIESKSAENQSAMHGAVITSPTAGEVVYENSLTLTANDPNIENATANDVHWALVAETDNDPRPCTGDIKFNRVNHPYTFSEDGYFEAKVDLQDLEAGEYCFVFNTELENPDDGERVVHYFYIVDEYTKVGGNIDNADYLVDNHSDANLSVLRGRGQLSHAFSGVVGNAGDAGIVGSVTVNYRQLKESVTYEAESLSFRAADGIGAGNANAVAEIGTEDGGIILVLDSNSSADYPRGAIIVRPDGDPGTGLYEIDDTPGTGGAASWIPMENGNNHNGTR